MINLLYLILTILIAIFSFLIGGVLIYIYIIKHNGLNNNKKLKLPKVNYDVMTDADKNALVKDVVEGKALERDVKKHIKYIQKAEQLEKEVEEERQIDRARRLNRNLEKEDNIPLTSIDNSVESFVSGDPFGYK